MSKLGKVITGAVAAVAIGASMIAASAPAEAGWRGRGGWGGPALAAGVIGGLAFGALAAQARPRYYAAPVYGGCFDQQRAVYDAWGNFAGYRVVRVCQ